MSNTITTINRHNKTIGFYHKNKPYIIGFKNGSVARNIMYQLHPNPKFMLLKNNPIKTKDIKTNTELVIDSDATLFIPKDIKSNIPKSNDDYYINVFDYENFIVYPYTINIGIIIPYVLIHEDSNEYVYKSHVIDPVYNSFDLT